MLKKAPHNFYYVMPLYFWVILYYSIIIQELEMTVNTKTVNLQIVKNLRFDELSHGFSHNRNYVV